MNAKSIIENKTKILIVSLIIWGTGSILQILLVNWLTFPEWISYLVWLAVILSVMLKFQNLTTLQIQGQEKNAEENLPGGKSPLEMILQHSKEIYNLLQHNLKNVTEETEHAALEITNNLEDINSIMKDLNDMIQEMQKKSDLLSKESHSTFSENDKTVEELQNYIELRIREINLDHQITEELSKKAQYNKKDSFSTSTDFDDSLSPKSSIIQKESFFPSKGRQIVKQAPFPNSESTPIFPPWFSVTIK